MSKGKGKNGGNGNGNRKKAVISGAVVIFLVAMLEALGYLGNAIPILWDLSENMTARMWLYFSMFAFLLAGLVEILREE